MRPANVQKIDDIEVLRAIAILFTLYQHFPIFATPRDWAFPHFAFWSGVDLFLVISGFVISRGLLNDRMSLAVLVAFWKRRAWRILPSAWLWLIISIAMVGFFSLVLGVGSILPTLRDALSAFFFVANINLHLCGSGQYVCGEAPQYWSLSLEEQFYFLLPIVLFLPRKWVVGILVAIVSIQLVSARTPGFSIENMIKSDALSLGVLLAMFARTSTYLAVEPTVLSLRWVRAVLSAALVIALAWLASQPFDRSLSAVTLTAAALVWISSYDRSYLMGRGLLKSAMVLVGARSYSLYIVHIPVFLLVRELFSSADVGLSVRCVTALAATAIISELNYRFVETRFRALGHKPPECAPSSVPAYSKV